MRRRSPGALQSRGGKAVPALVCQDGRGRLPRILRLLMRLCLFLGGANYPP